MKKGLLGLLGLVVGMGVGTALNLAFIRLNMSLHGPPEGLDFKDPDKVEAFMGSLPILGFLIVLLAHQSQAFVGSLIGTLIAGRRSVVVGLIIGVLTLVGCVLALFMIPGGPIWFAALDLLLPIPLAYLAARLVDEEGRVGAEATEPSTASPTDGRARLEGRSQEDSRGGPA